MATFDIFSALPRKDLYYEKSPTRLSLKRLDEMEAIHCILQAVSPRRQ